MLESKYKYHCDKNKWYAIGKDNIAHRVKSPNIFTLRVECFVWVFDDRRLGVIKDLAETMHNVLEPERELVMPAEMVTRQKDKDFGMQDYVD